MAYSDPKSGWGRGVIIVDEPTQALIVEAAGGKSERVLRQLGDRIEGLMDAAPSDASLSLKVQREREGYIGILKIYSVSRRFVAKVVDAGLDRVIGRIFNEAHEQLMSWKRSRDLGSNV